MNPTAVWKTILINILTGRGREWEKEGEGKRWDRECKKEMVIERRTERTRGGGRKTQIER